MMKTYIHKKLGWKAVESNPNTEGTPVTRNYKIYKSEDSKSYTLRSSLEIEGSEDWIHEEYYNILLNWFQSKFPSKKAYNQQLENVRKKIKEAEESGFSAGEFTVLEYSYDGSSWEQDPDFPESYNRIGFYTWEYKIKHNGVGMETPPADFKDRKILKVRRESDGEVFSVGSYVVDNTTVYKSPMKVSEILIGNDGDPYIKAESLTTKFHLKHLLNRGGSEEQDLSAETKEPTRIFNSTEDAELLAEMENRIDELSNKYEISLKFYSDLLALVEQYKNKIRK